ncbi:MAG: hypothetical protein LBQ71_03315 [Hungatella sp.]|jgi:hypothetical protein|nr:hypothetical protein [Hungatella sp.]
MKVINHLGSQKKLWEKGRNISKQELEEELKLREERRDYLEEKALTLLDQCKGMTVAEIKLVTESVLDRACTMAFLS